MLVIVLVESIGNQVQVDEACHGRLDTPFSAVGAGRLPALQLILSSSPVSLAHDRGLLPGEAVGVIGPLLTILDALFCHCWYWVTVGFLRTRRCQ